MSVPHEGLTHPKHYDVKDSNVELIGTDIDHKVKYASAASEPAWRAIPLSSPTPGVIIWRIEAFEVVSWPSSAYGKFYDGDSYIVLQTSKPNPNSDAVRYDIYFWLGAKTTQDEAGTAAYKTVELDEFLGTKATQHREVQGVESSEFTFLFSPLTILSGGVRSGFNHVTPTETSIFRLLQITTTGGGSRSGVLVREREAKWTSLNEGDVFVLDEGAKLTAWQGKKSSPIEKMKAAQAISAIANESDRRGQAKTEVLSQEDPRAVVFIKTLGGDVDSKISPPTADSAVRRRRMASSSRRGGAEAEEGRPVRLFRLSDASGTLQFDLIKNGENVSLADFQSNDVFIYDTGFSLFVWVGKGASAGEQRSWLKVAQAYLRTVEDPAIPLAKCVEGHESLGFRNSLSGVA